MSDHTKIEWTDATANVINGCTVHSAGCTNCYAMKQAHRFPVRRGLTKQSNGGMVWTGEVRFNEAALLQVLRWKKPRMIFWNAHGDMFHNNVPDEWIDRCFAVMALTPHHTHQVLTKRSDRMREYISRLDEFALQETEEWRAAEYRVSCDDMDTDSPVALEKTARLEDAIDGLTFPLPNVWLGVSVENQAAADERIPDLLATPAAVRWISAEPLIGPVDLTAIEVNQGWDEMDALNEINLSAEWRVFCEADDRPDPDGNPEVLEDFIEQYGRAPDGKPLHPTLDWVVCGGESGPKARPMHPDWARSLRDQCDAAAVPFLFKQWGEWAPLDRHRPLTMRQHNHATRFVDRDTGDLKANPNRMSDVNMFKEGKGKTGRHLDGVLHNAFPAREAKP